MPRSNWKGMISFGLVSIPISLINSENTTEKVAFHQIDKRNNARIKYQRINAETGREVDWENIGKGYVYSKDIILPVEEDELKKVAGSNSRTIAIEGFVKQENIKFIQIYKTYYLIPDKKGEKGYVILREALKKAGVFGIAKVIISTKEYLSAIGCYKNALVLYLLRYQENIRPLSDFDIPSEDLKKYKVNEKEINTALLLVKSMLEKWKPNQYKDEFQAYVHKWAQNKIKHKGPVIMTQRGESAKPLRKKADFIDLLKKSMQQKKKEKTHIHPYAKKKIHSGKRVSMH